MTSLFDYRKGKVNHYVSCISKRKRRTRKENDDGRESIAVHDKRDGKMVLSLGLYLVETEQDKQKALDKIFDTIMKG